METGDLAIAISYSGRTRPTVHAAQIAKAPRRKRSLLSSGYPSSPLQEISDIPIVTPPGINLFGADAVMTRALEIMFNEVLFHCLAFGNERMMQNVSRIEHDLRSERD